MSVTDNSEVEQDSEDEGLRSFHIGSGGSRLMTTAAIVKNKKNGHKVTTLIMIDTGSEKSFITESLAKELSLERTNPKKRNLSTFSGTDVTVDTAEAEVEVLGRSKKIELTTVTIPQITKKFLPFQPSEKETEEMKRKGVHWTNYSKQKAPDMLIGNDVFGDILTGKIVRLRSGTNMIETVIGWVTSGNRRKSCNTTTIMANTVFEEDEEKKMVENMWKLDCIGILDDPRIESEEQIKESEYQTFVQQCIQYKNGLPEVQFKWKDDETVKNELGDNYEMALRRIQSVWRTMKEKGKWEEYTQVIEAQIEKGILEECHEDAQGLCYHMPHHAVCVEGKKMRVVNDASSHMKGKKSLNECLITGTNLTNNLAGMMLRFREHYIVATSDVEAAFLNVRLQENTRDLLRILMTKDHNKKPEGKNIRILRFKRLPFGVIQAPFILAAVLRNHIEKSATARKRPEWARELRENLYVDNVLSGTKTREEMIEKYKWLKQLFNELSMNLRDFASNSGVVQESINKEDSAKDQQVVKVLGMKWLPKEDVLTYEVKMKVNTEKPVTVRTVTAAIARVYNPWGLLAPLLVKARIVQRKISTETQKWDKPISPKLSKEWLRIVDELEGAVIKVPRIMVVHGKHDLVVFVDASLHIYAACAYIRTTSDYDTYVQMALAKSRVAPLKNTPSIPRMELIAFLCGMRLAKFIRNEMNIQFDNVYILGDSEIVMMQIRADGNQSVFVKNRVKEIRTLEEEWKGKLKIMHVATSENVADDATRGVVKEAIQDHRWLQGPVWLREERKFWKGVRTEDEVRKTFKPTVILDPQVLVVRKASEEKEREIIVESERFSSFTKLYKTVAYVLRFLKMRIYDRLRSQDLKESYASKLHHNVHKFRKNGVISSFEKLTAMNIAIQHAQRSMLERMSPMQKEKMRIWKDKEGVARVTTRLGKSNLPASTISPILLDGRNDISRVIIRMKHKKCGHGGVNQTLAEVKKTYWITHGRRSVQKVINECIKCKEVNGLPYRYPERTDLPERRVTKSGVFENIGVDFTGPFMVHDTWSQKEGDKVYVCLFTCLMSRAIHMEITRDLSVKTFLRAFVRFTSRRGCPSTITSDNGSTFRAAETILSGNNEELLEECTNREIRWYFNVPLAPWQGGIFERMMRSVKTVLQKNIEKRKMNYDEFETEIIRAESVINDRPLVYVGNEMDASEILRPIDFVNPRIRFIDYSKRPEEDKDEDYRAKRLDKTEEANAYWIRLKKEVERVYKLWEETYLPYMSIESKTEMHKRKSMNRKPRNGDIVLVKEENVHRKDWKRAMITEVNVSQDQMIRSVKIRLSNGRILQRPVNLLIPLEIQGEETPQKKDLKRPRREQPERAVKKKVRYVDQADEKSIDEHVNHVRETPRIQTLGQMLRNLSGNITLIMTLALIITSARAVPLENEVMRIECLKNGVQITADQRSESYGVCTERRCISIREPQRQERIFFSDEETVNDFKVKWLYDRYNTSQTIETVCKGTTVCSRVDCYLCSEMVANPECYPTIAIPIIGLILYMSTKIIKLILTIIAYLLRWRRRDYEEVRVRRWAHKDIFVTLILIILVRETSANLCDQSFTLQAEQNKCIRRRGTIECEMNQIQQIRFTPLRRRICMRLENENKIISEFRIELINTELVCEQESMYFTRNAEAVVKAVKRCPGMGSCIANKCAETKINSKISELREVWYKPGHTRCSESCGSLGCKCGLGLVYGEGCIFYKEYFSVKDKEVFERVRCKEWKPRTVLSIEHVHQNGKSEKKTIRLRQESGEISIEKIGTIAVTQTSVNMIPILDTSQYFIGKDKGRVRTIRVNEAHEALVKCANISDAYMFTTCKAEPRCDCHPAENTMNCVCQDNDLTRLTGDKNILPIIITAVIIENRYGSIIGTTNEVSTEVILRLNKKIRSVSTMRDTGKCKTQLEEVKGCYKCAVGATIKITCIADEEMIATMKCGESTNTITCSKDGTPTVVKRHVETMELRENCSISCQEKKLEIKAKLEFVPHEIIEERRNPDKRDSKGENANEEENGFDFTSTVDWIYKAREKVQKALDKLIMKLSRRVIIGIVTVLIICIVLLYFHVKIRSFLRKRGRKIIQLMTSKPKKKEQHMA